MNRTYIMIETNETFYLFFNCKIKVNKKDRMLSIWSENAVDFFERNDIVDIDSNSGYLAEKLRNMMGMIE